MERLTNNKGELPKCNDCIEESNCYSDISCSHIFDALKKLAEYEDTDEQGLLLKLPCKVGDTVYRIGYNRAKNKIWGAHITTEVFNLKFYVENFTLFGKTVFLTQTEAEEALKKMESKG